MGKITTLLLVMSGLHLLFFFTGLLTVPTNTPLSKFSPFLDLLLNPTSMIGIGVATGGLAFVFATLLTASTVTGITVGSFISNIRYAIVAPFVLYIAGLIADSLIIFNRLLSVSPVFAVLFASPLFIVSVLSLYALWDSGITV